MAIFYIPEYQAFHLQTDQTSYVIGIVKNKFLCSLYWGRKIQHWNNACEIVYQDRAFSPNPFPNDRNFSLDTIPLEYPIFGSSDFRTPAIQILHENGSLISDFDFIDYTITSGKEKLAGLPSLYVEEVSEAQTLKVRFIDRLIGLELELTYTVFQEFNVITKSVKLTNTGHQKAKILRCLSANFDFQSSDFDLIHLDGAWGRERHISRSRLRTGLSAIESRRGASSHQHNPFIALASRETNEETGDVYAMSLVYSGNFTAQAEVDQFGQTRMNIGINPFTFSWNLSPHTDFQSPEAVLVYSYEGLGGLSRIFHRVFRNRLCRGIFRDAIRPVLINNWEATYFDFDEKKILKLADEAKLLGLELLVLDDGWFGTRNDDKTSLGDWFVNEKKLPRGLTSLANQIHLKGLKFGLWFEPEMISVESLLYKKHPDWCLNVPCRNRTEGRNQLVLDLTRQEVRNYITDSISNILNTVPIDYIKWDMNRHQTEVGSEALTSDQQLETSHRYILGLYEILEHLNTQFPQVLFEGCSGGGGRFDPGMLYYMPQNWTSDNTDGVSRLKIQYGTSLLYPNVSMGCHVSAVPNHQVGRTTSLQFRLNVAMSGNLGFELDLSILSADEKNLIREQVSVYKGIQNLIQFGDFYRIKSPFEDNCCAWMFVSSDKKSAWVFYAQILEIPNSTVPILKLKGLQSDMIYQDVNSKKQYNGDELMFVGLRVYKTLGDFKSSTWLLKSIE